MLDFQKKMQKKNARFCCCLINVINSKCLRDLEILMILFLLLCIFKANFIVFHFSIMLDRTYISMSGADIANRKLSRRILIVRIKRTCVDIYFVKTY